MRKQSIDDIFKQLEDQLSITWTLEELEYIKQKIRVLGRTADLVILVQRKSDAHETSKEKAQLTIYKDQEGVTGPK